MPFRRPDPSDVDAADHDAWCVVIDGEEENPERAQCPNCGHMPDDGLHSWTTPTKTGRMGGYWYCGGACGCKLPVVPFSVET